MKLKKSNSSKTYKIYYNLGNDNHRSLKKKKFEYFLKDRNPKVSSYCV